jgi:hypothetical protein
LKRYYEDFDTLEQELDTNILDNFELDEAAPF